jgi:hypothetical protein
VKFNYAYSEGAQVINPLVEQSSPRTYDSIFGKRRPRHVYDSCAAPSLPFASSYRSTTTG